MRTIAEAHNYVYALSPDAVWVHLYAASALDTTWTEGGRIALQQETDYPWSGAVKLTIAAAPPRPIALKLRIPGWLHQGAAHLRVNGRAREQPLPPGAYAEVKQLWHAGDTVELAFDFQPTLWEANPLVEETLNQVAVKYGPLVYCVEAADLPAGVRLMDVALELERAAARAERQRERIVNAEVVTLTLPALALGQPAWSAAQLYREVPRATAREFPLKLVPYFAWGNRGDTDMSVWLPRR